MQKTQPIKPREWTLHADVQMVADSGTYLKLTGPSILEDEKVIEHSAYMTAIEALKKINKEFGTDYADGNTMIANEALRKLGVEV